MLVNGTAHTLPEGTDAKIHLENVIYLTYVYMDLIKAQFAQQKMLKFI